MKIAVNARSLTQAFTDQGSRYTEGLLKSLTQNNPGHEFYFLFDRPYDSRFIFSKNITPIIIKPSGRQTLLLHWWYQVSLPLALQKIKPDVFISTEGLTTLKTKALRVTFLLPVQEFISLNFNFLNRKYYQQYRNRAARESEILIATSQTAAQSMVQAHNQPETKIRVIHPAANSYFKPLTFARQVKIREEFVAGESFFLLPELPPPGEDLNLLLQAFGLLKERTRNGLKLLIIGKKGRPKSQLAKTIALISEPESIIFTRQVRAETLANLYGSAVATIYLPSGADMLLPVLEAQQSGCPVISSPTGPVQEIAGTSALIPKEFTVEGLFAVMAQVYHDVELRNKLVKQGLQNTARFTWPESSRNLMQQLEYEVAQKKNAGAPV